MIKAGIIEGEGFIAGELIRLLLLHPDVKLQWISGAACGGKKISSVHKGLVGDTELEFVPEPKLGDADIIFLCLPPGESRKFMESHELSDEMKVVDLSPDYRAAGSNGDFIYGLPELNRKYIIRGNHVANPSDVATALQLALLPLAKNLLLNSDLHATVVVGSTADGMTVADCSLGNGNIFAYAPFRHHAVGEVEQTLRVLQSSFGSNVNLIPMRGSFARGLYAAVYLDCPVELEEVRKLYEDYYDDHRFTFIIDRMPDLRDVVDTNKCLLHLEKEGGKLLVVSAIDNILKGAAGQAIHNMNLLFGLHECTGLQLKASVF